MVFTIDSSQSQTTISGTLMYNTVYGKVSAPLSSQGPGSLTAAITGSINATVGLSTIQFTGSSQIDSVTNGTWQPAPGGAVGTMAAADYGPEVQANFGIFSVTGYAALRNVVLDIGSAALSVLDNQFPAGSLIFSFSTNSIGALDYADTVGEMGSSPLTGTLTNQGNASATLVTTGSVQKLTIPINATYVVASGNSSGTTLTFAGQIVAHAALPPPVIISLIVSNKIDILTVANATLQSQVYSSTDLKHWSLTAATATNGAGGIIFTTAAAVPWQFLRVKQ